MKKMYAFLSIVILTLSFIGCKANQKLDNDQVKNDSFITNVTTGNMTSISLDKKTYIWETFTPATNRYDGVVK